MDSASGRNWGCGDTTDLKALIDWVADRAGASFIALNPLHAIPNRQPFNTSPYLPNSIFYRNPIYLDVEQIADFRSSARARALLRVAGGADGNRRPARLRTGGVRARVPAEAPLPEVAVPRVPRTSGLRTRRARASFEDYIEREGDLLHRFAVHAALDEAIHGDCPDVWNWRAWPEQYQDPESPAVRRNSPENTGAAFCFTNTSNGNSICNSPPPSSTPSSAA